ncbi:MAG TPA: acetylglucosamine-6-sulfatase, partial [Bacteroidetes bacterium]|nr:acetylglucosamine-6-sulfatase [Bacteroidota bacterium]
MKNCWLITGASLWATVSCTGNREQHVPAHEPGDNEKRNIIFILSDDHRYDFMGFTGKVPWLETPNMDRLALNGARLCNAFVTTSLSSPSRASILTGLYSHSHTV